jgi:hypothetical protein
MKDFDKFFRPALLVILISGLFVAIWHISWLHRQDYYQMQVMDRGVFVVNQKTGRVYYARTGEILNHWTDVWHPAPALPVEP